DASLPAIGLTADGDGLGWGWPPLGRLQRTAIGPIVDRTRTPLARVVPLPQGLEWLRGEAGGASAALEARIPGLLPRVHASEDGLEGVVAPGEHVLCTAGEWRSRSWGRTSLILGRWALCMATGTFTLRFSQEAAVRSCNVAL